VRRWEAQHGSCVDRQLATDHAAWDEELVALVTGTTHEDFELKSGELDACLDLVVVARRA
jgi:hypothetical protein